MNNKFSFASGQISSKIKTRIYTADNRPEKYAGKKKLDLQGGNDYIYNLLQSDAALTDFLLQPN